MDGEIGGAGWEVYGTLLGDESPHSVATDGLSGFVLGKLGAGLPLRGASVLGQSNPDCVGRVALEVRNWWILGNAARSR